MFICVKRMFLAISRKFSWYSGQSCNWFEWIWLLIWCWWGSRMKIQRTSCPSWWAGSSPILLFHFIFFYSRFFFFPTFSLTPFSSLLLYQWCFFFVALFRLLYCFFFLGFFHFFAWCSGSRPASRVYIYTPGSFAQSVLRAGPPLFNNLMHEYILSVF